MLQTWERALKIVSEASSESDTGIVAFRASSAFIAATEAAAAAEGTSKSDVARRALIRDLERFECADAANAEDAARCVPVARAG